MLPWSELHMLRSKSENRAVATFEATEAVASVVFRIVASVQTITSSSRILHLTATIAVT